MKKFFSLFVVVVCLAFLVGCGDGGSTDNTSNTSDAFDTNATWWRDFDPRNLPEYRELPEPSADEPSATMSMGETPARAKSSNAFFNLLRDDLLNATGEVRLDFYGQDPLVDLYGDYLGSRTVKAADFFAGTAQEKVKAQEYWIHAITYCESSGYCFEADAHVLFFPNETNRVLFSFRPTGNVIIPCYIPNPAGDYLANRYDFYPTSLKANSAYIWHGPCYNLERHELELKISYSYSYGNLVDIDEEMELSVTATDGLHIMKFTFNLLDILTRQRPLELIAEEVLTGTIQYGGEFEFEKKEIIIDSPSDGDVVNFPLVVKGNTKGIGLLQIVIKNDKVVHESEIQLFDTDDNGVFTFGMQWDMLDGVVVGDNLTITMSGGDDSVRVDVVVGVDAVALPPVLRWSADTPRGIQSVGENREVAIVEIMNPSESDLTVKSLTPSFVGQWLAGEKRRLRIYEGDFGNLLYSGEWDPWDPTGVNLVISDAKFCDVVVPPHEIKKLIFTLDTWGICAGDCEFTILTVGFDVDALSWYYRDDATNRMGANGLPLAGMALQFI